MSRLELFRSPGSPVLSAPTTLPLVWDCATRAHALTAAFEVHEAAVREGFMPDEATTLSLTVAELITSAVRTSTRGVATVTFEVDGWRLEVPDAEARVSEGVRCALSRLVSERGNAGRPVAVAEYHRPLHG